MKQICLTILAMCVIAAIVIAATNEVTSVNVVGYYKLTLLPTNALQAAVQFDAFDPTLIGVLGTNQLRSTSKAAECDKVSIWNPSTVAYEIFARNPSDNQFHWATNFSGAATNPGIVAGEAFYISSPLAGVYAAGSNTIVLMGEVVDVVTQAIQIVPGYQMLAYGFSSDVNLQDLDFANDGALAHSKAANADQIRIWDPNTSSFLILALSSSDMKWHWATNFSGAAPTNINVDLGRGFWYWSQTNITWTWSETNRYINNL